MLAVLTDEQQALADVAVRVADVARLANPADLDSVDRDTTWQRLAETGMLGLRVRDEDNLPLAPGTAVRVVAEALGAALAPVPFVGTSLAVELLGLAHATAGDIDPLSEGEVRAGVALHQNLESLADAESGIGWDVDGAELVVAIDDPGAGDTVEVLLVDVGSTAPSALDRTRHAGVLVPQSARAVGTVTRADLQRFYAFALTLISADAVGAMRSALDGAIAYAKERVAYGVPIGSFQVLSHLLVDSYVDIAPAAALTARAGWAIDALSPDDALLAGRAAKAYTGRVGTAVAEAAIQVYGGIGVTDEHIAHFHARRILADRNLFGSERTQFALISDARLGVI